jgi:hypothetical protein
LALAVGLARLCVKETAGREYPAALLVRFVELE